MRHSFGLTPSVSKSRSKFDLSHGIKTSFNVGQLIPVDIEEVLPGDTFKEKTTCVTRVTSSFLKPVMDNLYMDIYHFFVPLRLVYSDFESVFGVAEPSQYVDPEYAEIPTVQGPVVEGSLADYFGLPINRKFEGGFISSLPFRAYALIYNKWFRNENAINETFIPKDDQTLYLNDQPYSPTNFGGMPANVGKKKDYFTSVLPKPQKGVAVDLALSEGIVPLRSYSETTTIENGLFPFDNYLTANESLGQVGYDVRPLRYGNNASPLNGGTVGTLPNLGVLGIEAKDLASFTVNDLRLAFQTQRILERDARYGSRYNEYLLGTFGVYSPDMRLQLPEYLGGGRIPISVQQVAQTSQASEDSPLANVAGYSLSNGQSHYTKGFVEHGYVITLACIRQMHTYSQGVSKMFTRLSRRDFYDTAYANLGEQPVYTHEIFVPETGVDVSDEPYYPNKDVLGYNEAWAEYRYAPSKITGQMRPDASASLDIWHFGDKFAEAPVYGKEFIEENPVNVDRTISVESSVQDQFICDFWFNREAIRVMPVYSVPGLIDHH